jgi:ABC-type lipopolysaccharide export system ATPase subunit
MEPEQLMIKSVTVKNFKSIQGAVSIELRRSQGRLIALVGVNGAGERSAFCLAAYSVSTIPSTIWHHDLRDSDCMLARGLGAEWPAKLLIRRLCVSSSELCR